jgi:UV DNA damage endonuclease
MVRLGLCCKFKEQDIVFKTTTVSYLLKIDSKGQDFKKYVKDIIAFNIKSLDQAIAYCDLHEIGCFRICSDFFPAITHEQTKYCLEELEDYPILLEGLKICKKKALEKNIRFTMHPGQFTLLSSPNDEVTKKSIEDLNYHAHLADLVGADVINIHLGGAYGDKKSALERVEKNFHKLKGEVRSKLTFENDDKIYSAEEVIKVCKKLKVPFVYDVHHHRCLKDKMSIEEATEHALVSWNKEPLFHISSPIEGYDGKAPNRHHDFININDFPPFWKNIDPLTVEVEAKAKELAVLKLQKELKT